MANQSAANRPVADVGSKDITVIIIILWSIVDSHLPSSISILKKKMSQIEDASTKQKLLPPRTSSRPKNEEQNENLPNSKEQNARRYFTMTSSEFWAS